MYYEMGTLYQLAMFNRKKMLKYSQHLAITFRLIDDLSKDIGANKEFTFTSFQSDCSIPV